MFLVTLNEHRKTLTLISGTIYGGLIAAGLFLNNAVGYSLLVFMASGMALGPFLGRYWCNWLCPRGSFLDYFISKISRNVPFPAKTLKSASIRTAVVAVFIAAFAVNVYFLARKHSPEIVFATALLRLLVGSTLISIIVGVLYRSRTWCAFCPGSTFIKITALFKNKKPDLLINNDTCKACGRCECVCPMQIASHTYSEIVTDVDCLKCGTCAKNCPSKALQINQM